MLWMLACAEPTPTVTPPEAHSWKAEGELVVEGLAEVERLWKAGHREAARTMAERVYTERWEPRLEPVVEQVRGEAERARLEYAYGLLLLELEGNGAKVGDRVHALQETAREMSAEAARAFPDPTAAPPPPPPKEGSRPIVPDVRPAWEQGG
ncbi:MAG: hypothetical protein ACOZNI_18810 [Myxococcota bacterium]